MDVAALRLKSGEAVRDAEERFFRPKSIAGDGTLARTPSGSQCLQHLHPEPHRKIMALRGDQVGPKL
jgi:hypothetical protein